MLAKEIHFPSCNEQVLAGESLHYDQRGRHRGASGIAPRLWANVFYQCTVVGVAVSISAQLVHSELI